MSERDHTAVFEAERARLWGLAYRMLGVPDDAEDVVQEAWLRFSAADIDQIDSPAAWLTTVVTRLSTDQLRSARHRRESYVGPWLPEPVDVRAQGPDEAAIMAESLSLGFLAVLERLSALERAVFLLHDVFSYPLSEVAEIIERSPSATRKLATRARNHVAQGRPRFAPEPAEIASLSEALFAATISGEVQKLESLLASDVVHVSDGGADHRAARQPILGRERVARLFVNLAKRWEDTMEAHEVRVNGQSGTYVTDNGEPFFLTVVTWVDGLVGSSFLVRNPDKLAVFHRTWLEQRGSER